MLAQVRLAASEVGHALKRLRVVGTELLLLERQRLLAKLEGVDVAAHGRVAAGEVEHAPKRVGVVRTEKQRIEFPRALALPDRQVGPAHREQRESQRVAKLRLD